MTKQIFINLPVDNLEKSMQFYVELGFTVVHYTLELSEDYVGKRYDALFTQIAVDQVGNNKDKVEMN